MKTVAKEIAPKEDATRVHETHYIAKQMVIVALVSVLVKLVMQLIVIHRVNPDVSRILIAVRRIYTASLELAQ